MLFTTFAAYQFYLIITILNQIFKENTIGSPLEKVEIKYPFITSILFFIFAIILDIHKTLSLVQYGCAILAIIFYTFHVKKRVELFLNHLEKKKSDYFARNLLHNIIICIAIYYIIYFCMKILSLFLENNSYHSYLGIASDMFKELSKYISFIMVIYFYYLDNKYLAEKVEDKKNNQQKEESNQNNQIVQINQVSQSKKPNKNLFNIESIRRIKNNESSGSNGSNGSSPNASVLNTSSLNFTSIGSSSLPL